MLTREERDVVRASVRSELTHKQRLSQVHAPSLGPVLREIRLTLDAWDVEEERGDDEMMSGATRRRRRCDGAMDE